MATGLLYQDNILNSILHGDLSSFPQPPSRVAKIVVVSTKSDFEIERRYLHEHVWPEFQRHCSSTGIDMEVLDIHQGNDVDSTISPHAFGLQLKEIEDSHHESLGCFLLCLIGNKYKPYPLPLYLESSEYRQIYAGAKEAGHDVSLLDYWYKEDNNRVPPVYTFQPLQRKYGKFALSKPQQWNKNEYNSDLQEWMGEEENILRLIQLGSSPGHETELINGGGPLRQKKFFLSGVHHQLDFALNLSPNASKRIVCVFRQFEDMVVNDPSICNFLDVSSHDNAVADDESLLGLQALMDEVIFSVNRKNIHYFSPSWEQGGISRKNPDHESYLEKFGKAILANVKALIDEDLAATTPDWQNLPPPMRKPIQEVIRESQSHLSNCRQYLRSLSAGPLHESGPLLQIQQLMLVQEDCMRHSPIIVCGRDGCGKSTLLSQVFAYCPEWLGTDVVRIVRHVRESPCTAFTPELLRNLCLHICLRFGFEISPCHYSFELGKLSIWFQDLLKLVEEEDNDLVIILDNLQDLRSAPNNQAAILGWLPWNLPPNVHIICSIAEEDETMLGLLKTRISTGENFIFIPPVNFQSAFSMMQSNLKDNKHVLTKEQWHLVKERLEGKSMTASYVKILSKLAKRWNSYTTISEKDVPQTLDELVNSYLLKMEFKYGIESIRKLCTYLTCTTFGLRKAEIVELLSCVEYDDQQTEINIESKFVEFSPTTWLNMKEDLENNVGA